MRQDDLFFRDGHRELLGQEGCAVGLGEPALVGHEDEGRAGVADLFFFFFFFFLSLERWKAKKEKASAFSFQVERRKKKNVLAVDRTELRAEFIFFSRRPLHTHFQHRLAAARDQVLAPEEDAVDIEDDAKVPRRMGGRHFCLTFSPLSRSSVWGTEKILRERKKNTRKGKNGDFFFL